MQRLPALELKLQKSKTSLFLALKVQLLRGNVFLALSQKRTTEQFPTAA